MLVAVVAAVVLITNATRHLGHVKITPSVSTKLWNPRAGYFCAGLNELSTPAGQNAVFISTMANAAPTAAAHTAMVVYYEDFIHLNPTTGDLARVIASYHCPSK